MFPVLNVAAGCLCVMIRGEERVPLLQQPQALIPFLTAHHFPK